MGVNHRWRWPALLCLVVARLADAQAAAAGGYATTRRVETDTLHDVALVRMEHGDAVIYLNPRLLQAAGPALAAFFVAHEEGHVAGGHAGAALLGRTEGRPEQRVRQELEADCRAARALGGTSPDVVEAAVRFFTRMGNFRFDAQHPTGAQRAAQLLACLPGSP